MRLAAFLAVALFAVPAWADIQVETIDYRDGDVALQGQVYHDTAVSGPRPGILVFHEWWGLNDYIRSRAQQLAEMGYLAFAVDMYGAGKVTQHPQQAQEWMQQVSGNIDAWQRRALTALETLKAHPLVAADRIAAIGYCFGGATVMQLAYSGADLDGVASFHGALPPATDVQARSVTGAVYVAHGGADAFIPAERVTRFRAALESAGVDLEFVAFPGVRHGFTNPEAAAYGLDNLAYDAGADQTSWRQLQEFFDRIFQ